MPRAYFEWTGSTATMKSYYYAGQTRLAERSGATLYYLLEDHLGSQALTLTDTGARLNTNTELRYYAYGATRYTAGSTPTSFNFTGQRKDAGSGLLFYNARWYDPVVGRFLQADTIVPEPGNPQSRNRYTCSLNNPVKYTDPTGHDASCPGHDAEQCTQYLLDYWLELGQGDQAQLDAAMPEWLITHQNLDAILSMAALLEEVFGQTASVLPDTFLTMYATSLAGGDLRQMYDSPAAVILAGAIFAGTGMAGSHFGGFGQELAGPGAAKVFKGIKIVRQISVNWDVTDSGGKTNMERDLLGLAPLGPDGRPINLHHIGQKAGGPIAEVTMTTHQIYTAILHKMNGPSAIDRAGFSSWREQYWQWRAAEALAIKEGE